MAQRRRKKQKRKTNKSIFPKIILAAFVIWSVVNLTSVLIETNKKNNKGDELQIEKESLTAYQESLEQLNESELDEDYIISEAQKEGYASSNERIFKDVDVAGQ